VSLWELVNAYRTLANGGQWNELRLIPGGNSAFRKKRIFSAEAAFLISDILSDREARSTTFGLENPLATRFWTAVKTGTSKDMRDNWCLGYSARYTVGVWVGNFSGEPMWNVSGISGAAPIWVEIMNWLHRREIPSRIELPGNLVKKRVEFPPGLEPPREEWFMAGTEPNLKGNWIGQRNQRIVYPPSGAVIALDPDIPPELQKIFLISQTREEGLRWTLNGEFIGWVGKSIPWSPRAGKYLLAITDQEDKTIDAVAFEVRGSGEE
jgi:penicillin-binding protein 1C